MTLRYFLFILLPLFLLTIVTQLQADVFKYQDSQGGIHFTDKPVERADYQLVWHKTVLQPQMVIHGGLTKSWASQNGPATAAPSAKPSSLFSPSWMSEQAKANRKRYDSIITEAARKVKLRPELLHAVIMTESQYDPNAQSEAGAQGLMQLIPETAKRYGVKDSFDPRQNVNGGASYLRDLLKMFGFNLNLALAGYNAGENAVIRHGNQIPPYEETQNYVKKVLGYYQENRIQAAIAGQTAGR
jgi:hypothetical protein